MRTYSAGEIWRSSLTPARAKQLNDEFESKQRAIRQRIDARFAPGSREARNRQDFMPLHGRSLEDRLAVSDPAAYARTVEFRLTGSNERTRARRQQMLNLILSL